MQITSTSPTSYVAAPTAVSTTTETNQREPSIAEKVNEIKGRYDMTSISPREMDQVAHELHDAGYDDLKLTGSLLVGGEEWNRQEAIFFSYITEQFGIPMEPRAGSPTDKIDLIARAEEGIEEYRKLGIDTTYHEERLAFLRSFYGKSGDVSSDTNVAAAAAEAALARQNTQLN